MLADKYERAKRLKQAIEATGMNISQAAERHSFKQPTLTSHANGTRAFDLEAGCAYARAFKVDPVWLLGIKDDPQPPSAENLVPLLRELLPLAPSGDASPQSLRALASALSYGIELLGSRASTVASDGALEVAVRGALSRFREIGSA